MTVGSRRDRDPCEYHQTLEDNQEAILVAQSAMQAHLGWLKKAGWWVIGLLVTACGALIMIGIGVAKYGWEMSVSHQVLTKGLLQAETKIVQLEAEDKRICKEIERIKDRASPFGGVKGEVTSDHPRWSE